MNTYYSNLENWTRERLFNYDVRLHEISKIYTYAIAKKDREEIKKELDLLQEEIQNDPYFKSKGLNLFTYLGQKKLDLDAQMIEMLHFMGSCWDALSLCS